MKKVKRQLVEVEWWDACSRDSMSLTQAVREGLTLNITPGWLAYQGKDKHKKDIVIVCREHNEEYSNNDFVVIPKNLIRKVIKK